MSYSIDNCNIKQFDGMVKAIAQQFRNKPDDQQDLMQEGYIGLIEAAKRYDPSTLWKTSWSIGRKLQVLLGGIYGFTNYTLYTIAINLYPKYWKSIRCLFMGYYDALADIRTINSKQ